MDLKNKNIQVAIIIIPVLLIVIYMIINVELSKSKWNNENLKKKYTIATICEFKAPVKSTSFFKFRFIYNEKSYINRFGLAYRINFKNEKHTNHNKIIPEIIKLSIPELEDYVGKRFYVKFIVNYPQYSELLLDKPVPDSIKEIPMEGWDVIPGE